MDRDTAHQELMAKRRTEVNRSLSLPRGVCSIVVCWAPCQALGMGYSDKALLSWSMSPPAQVPTQHLCAQLEAFLQHRPA